MKTNNRWVTWLGLALLAGGCAGCEPFEPRDDREEGPKGGLFSGPDGEFVLSIDRREFESAAEPTEDPPSDETNE